ncbi:putative RNA recognition motif (a k a RRM RBD or RNP domain) [Trypanosoma vivax]|nr:putative RNA-binding protein [Trypanosoma vivax]KAH8619608.1 putative RNA recognition motif (a k a RRM RBD or RNP domain) [Trypanosoma vivax]
MHCGDGTAFTVPTEACPSHTSQSFGAPFPICPVSPLDWGLSTDIIHMDEEMSPPTHLYRFSFTPATPSMSRQQMYTKKDEAQLRHGILTRVPQSKLTPSDKQSRTNLIVRNLSVRVDVATLKSIFSPYGEILSAAIMRNIHTATSLGTAFVRFATTENARAALVACHGRGLYGRALSVQWAKRQHDGTPVGEARAKIMKLFVRNVPLEVSAEELANCFKCFGAVEAVTLHKDTAAANPAAGERRLVRRIAFVTFSAEGVAEKAAEAVHNTRPFPSCGSVPLMVKLAEDNRGRRSNTEGSLSKKHASGSSCASPVGQSPELTSALSDSNPGSTESVHATGSAKCPTPTTAVLQTHMPVTEDIAAVPASPAAEVIGMHCSCGALSELTELDSSRITPTTGSPTELRRYVHDPYNPRCSRQYLIKK